MFGVEIIRNTKCVCEYSFVGCVCAVSLLAKKYTSPFLVREIPSQCDGLSHTLQGLFHVHREPWGGLLVSAIGPL
jgi:hypothetical protein